MEAETIEACEKLKERCARHPLPPPHPHLALEAHTTEAEGILRDFTESAGIVCNLTEVEGESFGSLRKRTAQEVLKRYQRVLKVLKPQKFRGGTGTLRASLRAHEI